LDVDAILTELRRERDRIDRAIAALEGGTGNRPGRPPAAASAEVSGAPKGARKRRRMNAKARKRISDAKKKWWAQRKRNN